MATVVKLEMDSNEKILAKRYLNKSGKAHRLLAIEIRKKSDPYVPFDNGPLKNSAYVDNRCRIIYPQIYARYHWYGKVMVGRAPKRVTNKDMRYSKGTRRGPFWTQRAWKARGKEVLKAVANETGGDVR